MSKSGKAKMSLDTLPIFRPSLGRGEIAAVSEVIKSGWVGLGPKTELFESLFSNYVGSRYAIALNSATAALHLSLIVLGIGEGDEVLVPSLTFVATVHAVLYVNARPVFVDVDKDILCMDPVDLERKITRRSKVIIPVHYGGHPSDLDAIHKIARRHGLKVIEDASHAAGSKYKGKSIGGLSDLTCFSFQAVKNLATGDGGMVTTNNSKLASLIKKLRWMGINKNTWEREELATKRKIKSYGWYYDVSDLGYKYHMNDITAAIGIAQLDKLNRLNKKRQNLARRYNRGLKKFPWLVVPIVKKWATSSHHNYVLKTPYRDKLNLFLKDKKISSGVHYVPTHHFTYYKKHKFKANVPVTEKVWKTLLTLPLYPDLSFIDQDRVISAIDEFNKKFVKFKNND